ncbi:MAG TPA: hypothetical protein VEC12_03255 [Bacteroidia bacterium]|nr:hypothetical protein [Bacteroidia bacterium]
MSEKRKIYLFYLSFRGNKNVPSWLVYTFVGFMAVSFLISWIFETAVGFAMMGCYPLLFFIVKQSIEIDTDNKLYRYGVDLAGFSFGKWQKLPEIQYVSVFNAQYRSYIDGDSGDYDINYRTEVNLVHGKNRKMTVWVGMSTKHAFNTANYFAENLDLSVLDATKRPFVWLAK